jgi:hypothetical protein
VARATGSWHRGGGFLRETKEFQKPTIASQSWVFRFLQGQQILKEFMRRSKVTTWFEPETRFEVAPVPAVPFRGTQETELDRLKARLLRQWLDQAPDMQLYAALRRAANEAAALAWFTPFPLLFFPALLEEKARAALRQGARQRCVRNRSETLLEEVVDNVEVMA